MISIKKDKLDKIVKLLIYIILVLTLLFLVKNAYILYVNKNKVEKVMTEINIQKASNEHLVSKINNLKEVIQSTKKSYPTTEEIETKLQTIFKRMSILDYNILLLGSKEMCIDRHILVAKIEANLEKDKQAALGILNYLGKTKQSQKDEDVYFVDYISDKKVLK